MTLYSEFYEIGKVPPRCAACDEPFVGDPKANVCNTCAANGNYVNAKFEDQSALADRVSREYAEERQQQLRQGSPQQQTNVAIAGLLRSPDPWMPEPTLDEIHDAFVQRPPRDDTGYIDTTRLEQDVARILEAQGPDWYLQPDESDDSEPSAASHSVWDKMCLSVGLFLFALAGLLLAVSTKWNATGVMCAIWVWIVVWRYGVYRRSGR